MSNRALQTLNLVTGGLLLVATGLVFLYAPLERVMGEVQRVFYFHVASAWVGLFAFLVTLIAGVIYLRTGAQRWDRIGHASVEIGLLFTIMTAVSGSIWARPAWNTWWTWDPRLTTYTIMALIYVAYLMLRQGLEDPGRRARFAAVYGIVGFISVPITFFAIRIWRTIHPVVVGNGAEGAQGGFAMAPSMLVVMVFSVVTFTVLYFCLLANRLRLEQLAERVEHLKAQALTA
jgi:heme exporter protein C